MASKLASPADQKWGFPFGIDGCLPLADAAKWLGNVSTRTVQRMVKTGCVRQGKVRGRTVICRKSIQNYLRMCES